MKTKLAVIALSAAMLGAMAVAPRAQSDSNDNTASALNAGQQAGSQAGASAAAKDAQNNGDSGGQQQGGGCCGGGSGGG